MRSADFQRALGVKPCARTEHFALHHVNPVREDFGDDLSTGASAKPTSSVDETCRLGLVVPKRMARRAVTRNLVKRQSRLAFASASAQLGRGDWLVRLRKPFDPGFFVSAASCCLRKAVDLEVQALFLAAGKSSARKPAPQAAAQHP